MDNVNIYTVSGLTKEIRFALENNFHDIWVEGEVSNFTGSSAGHAYFSIKDENSLLKCVMFKGRGARNGFTPEDGMHVLCGGRISVYDKRGQYQLYVKNIEPRGKGALQVAFEKLKAKLYEEGLFSETAKKALPVLPVCVGVITSPTGAAVRDILKVAKRRYPNIEVLIRPVKVQGPEAKDDLAQAVGEMNEFNRRVAEKKEKGHRIDVIILGRGGGSLEDLWPFNEEVVARAIYASEIPVTSAVGHEIDYTISDFVADLRAPTPSAAAELVVPLKNELDGRVKKYAEKMYLDVKKNVEMMEKTVERLKRSYVLRAPLNVFSQKEQQVDELAAKAKYRMGHYMELARRDLDAVSGKLKALSPLAVLERGYTITFSGGRVIRTVKDVKKNDLFETKFADGSAISRVE
ncbi:MAG: exodeoxyribonuclease VII large subunit [Candidatus Omnitrophota bacterium]